jgi:hypothetical protein
MKTEAQEKVDKLYLEHQLDCERLQTLGLPGCLAIGYLPGSRPGTLRPADPYHRMLVEALLRALPEVTLH